ncbi:MAG: hypothetical protein IPK53_14310 [bacterium]|nr:hypothetical protein [bacterium]
MNRTTHHHASRRDRGYVLTAMMALIAALLATGGAFMQWASDEALQGETSRAGMQAYYVAQAGVIEKGLTWLSSQQQGLLPSGETRLGNGTVPGIGRYFDVRVYPVFGSRDDNTNFSYDEKFRITAYGEVPTPYDGIEDRKVVRKAILYVQVRSFVDYMYLTNWETSATFPNDVIRFFGRDTLWGRTHSNDWIATQGDVNGLPVFYDIVSTTKPSFRPGSPNPAGQFLGGPPRFNEPPVLLPELAEPIRENADYFLEAEGHEWYCSINGTQATFYHWPEGTELDTNNAQSVVVNCSPKVCVFVDGKMEMRGVLSGQGCRLTVGCSGDIRLIDNVMIQGTNMVSGALPPNCTSILGIVSEGWIWIGNTWKNGREGCSGPGGLQDRCHIVITAALVSLRGSFQLEQMNDTFDPYNSPITPDERGNIVMTGSITQWRRGYVHRSNLGGTGYNKVYKYDQRFRTMRPPCFLGAVDDEGRVFFNIVQWGQAAEDVVDVAAQRRVRYN